MSHKALHQQEIINNLSIYITTNTKYACVQHFNNDINFIIMIRFIILYQSIVYWKPACSHLMVIMKTKYVLTAFAYAGPFCFMFGHFCLAELDLEFNLAYFRGF